MSRLCLRNSWVCAAILIPLTFWPGPTARAADWLIDPTPFVARVITNSAAGEVELNNGLVRRVLKLQPNAATIAFDNLMTGSSLLRGVRPEALLELNTRWQSVGGLVGQPIQNFLSPAWVNQLTNNPEAFRFTGLKTGRTVARFPWKKHKEWLSQDPPWPPPGVSSTLRFDPPPGSVGPTIEIHYELYDGLPLLAKWFVLRND